MEQQVLVYKRLNGDAFTVKADGETVWLTQDQMCQLFGRERSVITKHIRNVFREGELDEKVSCAKFAHNTPHGAMTGRTKTTMVTVYNLERGDSRVAMSVLAALKDGAKKPAQLRTSLGIKSAPFFTLTYLKPLAVDGLIEMTNPASPNSPQQSYRLTSKGYAAVA